MQTYCVAFVIFALGLVLCGLGGPQAFRLQNAQVPYKDIYIVLEDSDTILEPFSLGNGYGRVVRQQLHTGYKARHYSMVFDEHWPVAGPRSVYLPGVSGTTYAYINNIETPRPLKANPVMLGLNTHYAALPVERWQLHPGVNRFDIQMRTDTRNEGLAGIWIGPETDTQNLMKRHARWARSLPLIGLFGGALGLLGALAGLVFGKSRAFYASLGLASVVLCALSAPSIVSVPLIQGPSGKALLSALNLAWIGTLGLMVYTRPRPLSAISLGLICLALIGPLMALALTWGPVYFGGASYWVTLILAGGVPWLVWASLGILRPELTERASQLVALRQTIDAQAEALDESAGVIAREMRNRAVLEERQRFTRDIHDGIGGQLLSLLLRLRTGKLDREQIVTEIEGGLKDLRLVVDSMDHTGGDLETALASFRIRAAQQMQSANVRMAWHQPDTLYGVAATTGGTLDLYRFLQEVLTNIVKHAKATHVDVWIEQHQPSSPLRLHIKDNGVGLPDGALEAKTGRGLTNLATRAKRLGGTLRFTEGLDGGGLGVELLLPPETTHATN